MVTRKNISKNLGFFFKYLPYLMIYLRFSYNDVGLSAEGRSTGGEVPGAGETSVCVR